MRRAIQRDANHGDICDHLRKHGVDVIDLSTQGGGVADIATNYKQRTVFIEIKTLGSTANLKKKQVRFLALWSGYCGIARNEQEALDLATDPVNYALTDPQKNKLAEFYMKMQTAKVHLATITKLLEAE